MIQQSFIMNGIQHQLLVNYYLTVNQQNQSNNLLKLWIDLLILPIVLKKKFDENLFLEFTKKVTIWDYASISRESYLALSRHEKEKLIKHFYSISIVEVATVSYLYFFSLVARNKIKLGIAFF